MSESAGAPATPAAPSGSESAGQTSDSNQTASTGAAASPAESSAQQAAINQLFKVMIDGEEAEVDLDTLRQGYSHASAANKRMQAAAAERKAAESEAARIKEWEGKLLKNPIKALHEANIPPEAIRKYLEDGLWEFYQQDQMTDEQKESAREKKRMETEKQALERQKAEIEQWKSERAKEREEAEVIKHQQEYAAQIKGAMEKHGLPNSPAVVGALAGYMSKALENGYELSIDQAAEIYKEENQTSVKSYLKGLSPAQLKELLGEDGVKQFRADEIAQLKNPTPTKQASASKPMTKQEQKQSAKDFFKNLGKR